MKDARKKMMEMLQNMRSTESPKDDDGYEADDEVDEGINEEFFGDVQATITGLRYYQGLISRGETVALVREQNNIHDKNAIRVDNIFGAQIGHLKREFAACFSQIMDNKLAKIDGVVPCNKNAFTMPVTLSFYGKAENRDSVKRIVSQAGFLLKERSERSERSNGPGNSATAQPLGAVLGEMEFNKELGKMFENLRESDKTEEREPAACMKSSLFPHQKKALAWMYRRENDNALPPFWKKEDRKYVNTLTNSVTNNRPDSIRGGILADDMGLGKTVEMISLIVSSFKDGDPLPVYPSYTAEKIETTDVKNKKETNEKLPSNERKTISFGDSTVSSFNGKPGPSKQVINSLKNEDFDDFDFDDDSSVENNNSEPTTSAKRRRIDSDDDDVVELKQNNVTEKQNMSALEKRCDYVDLLSSDEDEIPLIEEYPKKPIRLSEDDFLSPRNDIYPRGTLIVCPLSVIAVWRDQIRKHLKADAFIEVYQYYGTTRTISTKGLKQKDVVLTTYSTLTAASKRKKDPLFEIEWLRIVLDEAHCIRNPNTQQSKACCTLRGERRWVLTGTPIQNRLLDLYSLVKFLKVQPLDERGFWRVLVERHVNRRTEEGLNRIRCLMEHLAMRRVKTQIVDGKPLVALPEKTTNVESLEFSVDERILYDAMHKEGKLIVNRYIREGTLLHNYAQVLVILLRLRQLCCHPFLVKNAAEKAKQLGLAVKLMEDNIGADQNDEAAVERLIELLRNIVNSDTNEECSICLDSLKDAVITPCAHVFCRACVTETLRHCPAMTKGPCPMCRSNIVVEKLISIPREEKVEDEKFDDEEWQSSAKIEALMTHLIQLRIENPTEKSVVISQFTSLLNVVEIPLTKENIRFARLDGTMTEIERRRVICSFSSKRSDSPKVLLLSMKAGGVGINLTAATRVFLMDPAWNPAIEDQCFDRCHRLGQTKPVFITKFVVKGSVEERMLELQARKRHLMEDVFAAAKKTNADNREQRIQDIKLLMR